MSSSAIRIRPATPDDAAGIVAVMNPIIAARCYTVNRIVGLQTVSPFADFTHAFDHVGVIGTFVDLSRRRQGIARRLFGATFDAASRKGYEKFFSYVRADNEAALHTYLSRGFRIAGTAERQAKIDGRYIDEIVIEKQLTSTAD